MTDQTVDIDSIPIIKGHGRAGPEVGGCIWDLTIYKATNGRVWRDGLPCFNAVIVRAGQVVNDRGSQELREQLRAFEPRLVRCRRANNSGIEKRINQRLALWCARYVENSPEAIAFNDATEKYLAGKATSQEFAAYVADAAYAADVGAVAAADAAYVAAAYAADADVGAVAVGAVAVAAAYAAGTVDNNSLLRFYDELIDQWEKIAADEGALADLAEITWDDYIQTGGS